MPTPDASQYTFIHKLQTAQECEKYIDPKKLRVARQYVTRPIGFDTLFGANALKSNKYLADLMSLIITALQWMVSNFAGSTYGYEIGAGDVAQFRDPSEVVLDTSGNVYVADTVNNKILKIDATTRDVSLFAGIGNEGDSGDVDGDRLTVAKISAPKGMCFDGSGNLYFVDSGNFKIKKISGSTVSTLAGDGISGNINSTLLASRFTYPLGLAVNSAGTVLYVTEPTLNKIKKIDVTAGTVTDYAGTGTQGDLNGAIGSARFYFPFGIHLVEIPLLSIQRLYFTDSYNNKVKMIDVPTSMVSTVAGNGSYGNTDGLYSAASFKHPTGISFNSGSSVGYIADTDSSSIRKLDAATLTVSTFAGDGTYGDAIGPALSSKFRDPTGLVTNSTGEIVYVADRNSSKIKRIKFE